MPRFPTLPLMTASLLATITAPFAIQAQQAYAQGATAPAEAATEAPATAQPPAPGMGMAVGPGYGAGLGLAADLAATQIYLGITAEQQPAWSDYCLALIAFLEPGFAAPMALAPPPAPNTESPPSATPAPLPRLRAERMAQQALDRADRAKALLLAATALRGTLESQQLLRLTRLEGRFPPRPEPAQPEDQAQAHPRRGWTPEDAPLTAPRPGW